MPLKHYVAGDVCVHHINLILIKHFTGEFVDDYTVRVDDVFAMPQSGTGVSVEAVDPVFQAKMLDMLKQTGQYNLYSSRVSSLLVMSNIS